MGLGEALVDEEELVDESRSQITLGGNSHSTLISLKARDYDQRAVSCVGHKQMTLPVSGIAETRLNILCGEVGKVMQNILGRHARREVRKHIIGDQATQPRPAF
ncbi:hypothetical protein A9Q02_02830 [Candidatus Chloroploca asiatica]|uniref:Uncharacterized protein n=1 Tax=Candidatus Chloroploca asiatica TaxID=1506545 RepID=A0A2H3KJE0_9CHLR|nr:hypothetical protein A9Q02_02830 [Candidatus Chloroploca asiatica]